MLSGPVRFSELKHMARSPAHYKAAVEAGRSPTPSTPARRFGSLVDALAFGRAKFAVWPGTRRGKDWEKFESDNADRLIVTATEHERALACAKSLQSHADAMRYLDGERQKAIAWEWMGRACHSTLDSITQGKFISDLKTARTTEPARFKSACLFYAYHAQHWFYGRAAAHVGLGEHEHYIVGVESAPPFAVTIFHLTPRTLLEGEKLIRVWFERVRGCEEANEWPGYAQTVLDLDVDEDAELVFGDEDDAEAA